MAGAYMNPAYGKLMRNGEPKKDEPDDKPSVSGGRHVRTQQKFLKSEVNYEHPSRHKEQQCRGCIHFVRPHACTGVAGYIRPEDWCKRFVEGD